MDPNIISVLGLLVAALVVTVNLAFAAGVAADAADVVARRGGVELAPRWAWATAAVVGGPGVAVCYWLVHHSRLRPAESADETPRSRDALGELFDQGS